MKVKYLNSSDIAQTIENVQYITPIENGNKFVVEYKNGERNTSSTIQGNKLLGVEA